MKSISKALALFLITALIFSCKKSSSSSSSYYVKGTLDGTAKNLTTTAIAAKSNLGSGVYNLTIVGTSTTEELAISLWSDQDNFTAGSTYSIAALGGTTENTLSYVSPIGSSAPSSLWNTTYDFGTVQENFTCTITEATSAYVKGTYSGTIYMATDSAVVSKTVTAGEFYAKF